MKYQAPSFSVAVATASKTPCTTHHPDAKGRCMRCTANLKDGEWHRSVSDDGVEYQAKWTRRKAN